MIHLPKLIEDLALILMAAGVVTLIFRRIRQPVVLGYILAGFLVGPHFVSIPTITDLPNVNVWGEIGVIFLLFSLGLEFSFRKLLKVGGAATITTIIEVASMTLIGLAIGHLMGWSHMDSLFLGGILAISSTTIIIRAFDEANVKSRGFVHLVFGVLIVEDLVAVVLLVLLSTLAVSKQFDGSQMILSVAKLVFFLVLWYLGGVFILPPLLRVFKKQLNQETLLVVSLGLCFMLVVLASKVGFSPALGAFMMGSILAETTEAERVEHLLDPVKNLFAAVFFVSVGMLIDPKIIVQHAGAIVILTLVTIYGKILSTTLGALISGQSLKHSIQSGCSLAQIGEFSFIIAALGLSLKVTSDFLYPIAVSVSAITTFCTPYLIRSSDSIYAKIERKIPARWLELLSDYANSAQSVSQEAEWRPVFTSYLTLMVTNGVLIIAIFLLLSHFLPTILAEHIGDPRIVSAAGLSLALLAASPFIWAMLMLRPKRDVLQVLWNESGHRLPVAMIEIMRFVTAVGLLAVLSAQFVGWSSSLAAILVITPIALYVLSRHVGKAYRWFEDRMVENLSARKMEKQKSHPRLAPWDAHIAYIEISPESEAAGYTLEELKVRDRFGVTVALIERGKKRITAPLGTERVFPHDRLAVIGTDEQIERLRLNFEPPEDASEIAERRRERYSLQQIHIGPKSQFAHKSIRESEIRQKVHGLVVGVEREGQRILNPDSAWVIRPGDSLWIVADGGSLTRL